MNLHDRDITRAAKRDGIAEGILKGEQRKAIEDAKALLADGKYSPQKISDLLNIPVEFFVDNNKGSGANKQL